MESDFNTKELKAFQIQEITQPVIRVIEDGVTMDVDPNSIPAYVENGASGERPTTPQAASTSSDGSSGLSTGAIVGIVVGSVAAIAIIAVIVVMVTRRKRQPTIPESEPDSIPSDNSGSPKMDSTKDDEL